MEPVRDESRKKAYHFYRLAVDVLVVASVNDQRNDEQPEWAAYIGAHRQGSDWKTVARNGAKLPQAVAEILFPQFRKTHRWRA